MRTNELSRKECTERRAHWEAFSFGVCPNGIVNVQNSSYGDDSKNHIYSVDPVAGRELVKNSCSCKAAKYRDGLCKHQVAVRKNAAIMLAVERAQDEDEGVEAAPTPALGRHEAAAVATDGGTEIIVASDDGEILDDSTGDVDTDENEDDGEDTEQTTLDVRRVVRETFEHRPVLDFDVYRSVLDCIDTSVSRLAVSEVSEVSA